MKNTKIDFSPTELSYINNAAYPLIKRIITSKVYDLFYELAEKQKGSHIHKNFKFHSQVDSSAGKITKGENYKGLPYIILDFPRLFDKRNVFAFRTMFWWGNYFSFTMHIKGDILKDYRDQILSNWKTLHNSEILVYNGKSEWNHDLSDPDYYAIDMLEASRVQEILGSDFVKLATRIEINSYESLLSSGVLNYERFLKLLS